MRGEENNMTSALHTNASEGIFQVPAPANEPIKGYGPGAPEKKPLKARLDAMAKEVVDIPCIIGGKEVRTGKTQDIVMPHDHGHVLAKMHLAGKEELEAAAAAAVEAQKAWANLPWQERAAVMLRAAELLAGPYRDTLNAATMLGQSKNVFQAEIDSACELIDFFRFNARYYQEILTNQPMNGPQMWNRLEFRPLEGFVLAITPFNFTSIAGNLPTSPALCGNAVIWKPSRTSALSSYYLMKLFDEAGFMPGIINFIGAPGPVTSEVLLPHPNLAGVHFTGSTAVFQNIYQVTGNAIKGYRNYPRIVGETGGKDFIFAHASADVAALATAAVRGAFEYQGQKCSAASRMYVPKSLWSGVRERIAAEVKTIKMGDPRDFTNFMNAVIDKSAFDSIKGYIEHAKAASDAEVIIGGGSSDETGYFIEPTVIEAKNPKYRSMVEEIFGPVLTVFVYDEGELDETLRLCDESSAYGLTGAVFAKDRAAIQKISAALRFTAGNFYINDKPTGAVVGQQPFGGSRASGTNDKAGSALNLMRWLSPRAIKENLLPPKDYRYPFLGEE
jgi:1-pyrroline-5-carboxylate dehydrogenase